jgi:hypothetical protein
MIGYVALVAFVLSAAALLWGAARRFERGQPRRSAAYAVAALAAVLWSAAGLTPDRWVHYLMWSATLVSFLGMGLLANAEDEQDTPKGRPEGVPADGAEESGQPVTEPSPVPERVTRGQQGAEVTANRKDLAPDVALVEAHQRAGGDGPRR